MKLAVIFPGVGYHADKPLLYYSSRLVGAADYEVMIADYGTIPKIDKMNQETIEPAIDMALESTKRFLKEVHFSKYEKIIFISKSIGTAIATRVCHELDLDVPHICYTPLEQTFKYPIKRGIIFHGTVDPWARTDEIRRSCNKQYLPLFLIEGANHSLEKAEPLENIEILYKVMKQTKSFLCQEMML